MSSSHALNAVNTVAAKEATMRLKAKKEKEKEKGEEKGLGEEKSKDKGKDGKEGKDKAKEGDDSAEGILAPPSSNPGAIQLIRKLSLLTQIAASLNVKVQFSIMITWRSPATQLDQFS